MLFVSLAFAKQFDRSEQQANKFQSGPLTWTKPLR
ncbi:hypothetical protein GGP54_003175 [Salinibacter ruber]|uniref:Uncharacterized protein n=1 Tax=Salinibacter ruber TaxID=146919 RepID=A0A9X2ZEK0_9BACT|nr:hypothetical protein [Salinibacter ruber]MCS4038064.1 hypothetical protein [Salinibacter ruber]